MTDTAITQFIAPVADLDMARNAYQGMKDFVSEILRENVDFGKVPGTDKPTLFKPGAEKLSRFFGLFIRLEELVRTEDWTGIDHNHEAFFFYRYKAKALRGDAVIAEGIGSCSSWEKKYRYRNAERVCPECAEPAIIKGKKEYGGGWLCFKKKGGCGAKFDINDESITGQEVGQVINPNPADLVNTIDKMAQKRAIVAVVLLACNASEYFTQDMEDYTEATFTVETQDVQFKVDPPTPTEKVTREDVTETVTAGLGATMTLETAEAMLDSKGVNYGSLDTKTIAAKFNEMDKRLRAGEYSGDERIDKQMKRDACKMIMDERNK